MLVTVRAVSGKVSVLWLASDHRLSQGHYSMTIGTCRASLALNGRWRETYARCSKFEQA
jgi:hypothetical protein